MDRTMSLPSSVAPSQESANMLAVAKRQRLQDALFHRLTQFFSLLVLVALVGIVLSSSCIPVSVR